MASSKLVSMRVPKSTQKQGADSLAPKSEVCSYPYNLRITLEKDQIKQLGDSVRGITAKSKLHLLCKAEVTGVNYNRYISNRGDEECISISLQITDLGIDKVESGKSGTIKDLLSILKNNK